jgi:Outer membrane efflux protein
MTLQDVKVRRGLPAPDTVQSILEFGQFGFRGSYGNVGGHVRLISQNQEFPLTCIWSAFSRRPSYAGRTRYLNSCDDRCDSRTGPQGGRNDNPLHRTYFPSPTSTATVTAGPVGVGANTSTSSSARGTISAVSLQWLLFDFGARESIIEAAKQASVISNIAFTAALQQVIYDVSVAFYLNAAARARAATAAQSLKNAQAGGRRTTATSIRSAP